MKQEIVGGGDERRRGVEMGVDGPKGFDLIRVEWDRPHERSNSDTHRRKRCDFFDAFLVTDDLVSRSTLLAEPEYPAQKATRVRGQK